MFPQGSWHILIWDKIRFANSAYKYAEEKMVSELYWAELNGVQCIAITSNYSEEMLEIHENREDT